MRLTINTRHRRITILTGDDTEPSDTDGASDAMVTGPASADLSIPQAPATTPTGDDPIDRRRGTFGLG